MTELLRHQPHNTEAYFSRAALYQGLGRNEEAWRDYTSALDWSPPYAEAYFNRAQTLVSLGRTDEALADYERVLILTPDRIETFLGRGRLHFDLLNFGMSEADVDAGLRLNPQHAKLLCMHGLLRVRKGSLDQAWESFTKSIEADPSLPDAWANRATVSFKRGNLSDSASDLTRALSLREDWATLYNRGRVFEAQKKWVEAAEDYSRALFLTPGNAQNILRHRARCYREMHSGAPRSCTIPAARI